MGGKLAILDFKMLFLYEKVNIILVFQENCKSFSRKLIQDIWT
jgi:hypothetical protein